MKTSKVKGLRIDFTVFDLWAYIFLPKQNFGVITPQNFYEFDSNNIFPTSEQKT